MVYKTWMLWPAVILLAIFFIWPIAMALYYSFTNLALSGAAAKNLQFIGLANYARMLKDGNMLKSVRATLVFLIGSVIGQTVLGFFMASLMKDKNTNFRRITGSCVLTGWVMPEVVAAICMYAFFYSKDIGTVNRMIGVFGLKPVAWLYEHALLSVTVANIWLHLTMCLLTQRNPLCSTVRTVGTPCSISSFPRSKARFSPIPCSSPSKPSGCLTSSSP